MIFTEYHLLVQTDREGGFKCRAHVGLCGRLPLSGGMNGACLNTWLAAVT